MGLLRNYIVIRRIQTMTKETSEKSKDTKPRRKSKLERTTEAQLFLEQDELQKQLEAEELSAEAPESKSIDVDSTSVETHKPCLVRRLRKL